MEISELYQELIVDHGTCPRNHCELPAPDATAEGFNPLCGDKVTLYVQLEDNIIRRVTFKGEGCAISMASASILTELLRDRTLPEAQAIFAEFQQRVTQADSQALQYAKLEALAGVRAFPSRVKCATLAWHTLMQALNAKS